MDQSLFLTIIWTFHLTIFAVITNGQDEISVSHDQFAQKGCTQHGVKIFGNVLYKIKSVNSAYKCQEQCKLYPQCKNWMYYYGRKICTLFSSSPVGSKYNLKFASGPKYCKGATPTVTPTTIKSTQATPTPTPTTTKSTLGTSTTTPTTTKHTQDKCPPGEWLDLVPESYICYKIALDVADWKHAVSQCKELGGHLATIANEDTHIRLLHKLSFTNSNQFYDIRRKLDKVWIGLKRAGEKGDTFEWSDGTPYLYSYWNNGEPSNLNKDEDCVDMLIDTGGWNVLPCSEILPGYVCQISKI